MKMVQIAFEPQGPEDTNLMENEVPKFIGNGKFGLISGFAQAAPNNRGARDYAQVYNSGKYYD